MANRHRPVWAVKARAERCAGDGVTELPEDP